MEGIGLGDSRGSKRTPGAVGRVHSDTIRGAEEWEEPEGAEGQQKKARDAEFTNLAETFQGRRSAIDGIMNKACFIPHSETSWVLKVHLLAVGRFVQGVDNFPCSPYSCDGFW
ncbi:hypothetical protein A0H81_00814 [Grifola frondosa]|uniref:Uncharacterized protein n=1 Tax=Grifola frondosa TaxID=5627 RepID=A0A1C7MP91_GRIFR|nr:hypothetical protein A0H81_00814 [Grifola frondosa]